MQNVLRIVGREAPLFDRDVSAHEVELRTIVSQSRFLVIGAAGTIGQAVTREIFRRNPRSLHAVDISENNLVELVRDLRSTIGYTDGEFATFALDSGSLEFRAMVAGQNSYDYVLNLSALKHVRSEKDPFTLMRMIDVNVLSTLTTIDLARRMGSRKYFCVSTDKAANPVNMMGASKRIMEMHLDRESRTIPVSTARFANVAFSDGSLLHGFNQRFAKRQPLSAPRDVRRYFVSAQEAGELCLMSCLLGNNREIFFPKLSEDLHLIAFSDIAVRYLHELGYEAVECGSEDEARRLAPELIPQRRWPCHFFDSDTTGEKPFEEFYTSAETPDFDRFDGIGVILNPGAGEDAKLDHFLDVIASMRRRETWTKGELVELFRFMMPDFDHRETGKYLDARM